MINKSKIILAVIGISLIVVGFLSIAAHDYKNRSKLIERKSMKCHMKHIKAIYSIIQTIRCII